MEDDSDLHISDDQIYGIKEDLQLLAVPDTPDIRFTSANKREYDHGFDSFVLDNKLAILQKIILKVL